MRIGIDIVETGRIAQAIERSGDAFVERLISAAEMPAHDQPANVERIAGVWAAKEAAVKALGTGFRNGITFHDIKILHDPLGKPYFEFSGEFDRVMRLENLKTSILTISHCKTHAVAAVVLD
ncbi:holo-ACP synthase [Paraburkholderia silviterrae]|uniref:Holo-[acyl-carrier-protein] synthase n=1 Tax=Paraburkholderia silviterrae TaxID=2528715 RepID=A0A4R5LXW1_9BURK|nr:holo-ACP synthase [Paraburkholderia silviterrae]TDG17118.1 holo-[acyl-carrier-protein] synthase [Paraburkholderia silviterrae]